MAPLLIIYCLILLGLGIVAAYHASEGEIFEITFILPLGVGLLLLVLGIAVGANIILSLFIFFAPIPATFAIRHFFHIQAINKKRMQEDEQRRIRERQAEEQRRDLERRNLEQWKQTTISQVNNIFSKDKQYNLIFSALTEYGENNEKASFIENSILPYFNSIEEWTLDELYARNFTNAVVGLKILHYLEPTDNQYKTAYDLLETPVTLIPAMQKHGLSRDSKYIKAFRYQITTDTRTGATTPKSLI